ncbi:MAG: carbohydrate binding domain-containing protein [bacterium]|nr:carbohydrate binding domain-containing protein [bacterium]
MQKNKQFSQILRRTKKGTAAFVSALMVFTVVPMNRTYAEEATEENVPKIGQIVDITTKESEVEETKDWQLVWNDEFSGTALDQSKWGYMVGTGAEYGNDGWGNSECEYYTAGENAEVKDGKLIITAKQTGDQASKYGGKAYTSTRIWTKGNSGCTENGTNAAGTEGGQALFAKKYGRFEAAISLPEGTGYWPAFWMMPAYDKYGVWAASGEIDIMEARGRVTNSVGGTIHYGDVWPNNKYNGGTYTKEGFNTSDEHVYALEWEPGEMRWYVDNELYYKTSNWFSKSSDNADDYTYGAPFDQPFYIMLNLAVGGNYDEGQLDQTIDGGQMKVDYVRVYDLVGQDGKVGNYNENVTPSTATVGELLGGKVGDNLTSSSLDTINKVVEDYDKNSSNGWDLLALSGFGGDASAAYADNAAKISIANGGSQTYSVQLTHKLPLTYGYTYQVSFKAKADAKRTASVKLGQAGGSFAAYTDTFIPEIMTDWNSYIYTFDMKSETDENCRLEINMGQNTSSVYVKDLQVVSIGKTKVAGENEAKEPLSNGEHIYNGTFDQGNKVNDQGIMTRMKYWNTENVNAVVDASTRQLKLVSTEEGNGTLSQVGLQMLPKDMYKLSFDAKAGEQRELSMKVMNSKGREYLNKTAKLTSDMETYTYEFTVEEQGDTMGQLIFQLGDSSIPVFIDNISIVRTTDHNIDYSEVKCYLLGNGNFEAGTSSWRAYQSTMGIDTVDGANQLWIAAAKSTNNYDMMLLNENLLFKSGLSYTLKFKAKTTGSTNQPLTVRIQRDTDWTSLLDKEVTVVSEWKEYEYEFKPSYDDSFNLKFLLSGVTENCNFNFKDIELYVTNKPVLEAAYLYDTGETLAQKDVTISYITKQGWEDCKDISYYVNDQLVDSSKVTLDKEKKTVTIDGSLFEEANAYVIKAVAPGFDMTNSVTHTVLDKSGNLVTNGDFSKGITGWNSYFTNGCGSFSVENQEAKVNFTWHEGQTWDLQLYQEGINLKANKKYSISFKAKATIDRDIAVEFPTAVPFQTISLTKDYQTFSYEYTPSEDVSAKINFLLGNINNLNNVENPHTIYFDDIVIKELVEEAPTYKITYNVGAGKNNGENPATYQLGDTIVLKDATLTGYTFNGWYTDSAYKNKVTQISADTSGDLVLYAKFTKIVTPPKPVAVTGISLNATKVTLLVGKTFTLSAKVLPTNATDKSVTYTSSNTKIAKVSSAGKITAVAAGKVYITAKVGNKSAKCTITVVQKPSKVKGINISGQTTTSVKVSYKKLSGVTGYQIQVVNGKKIVSDKKTSKTSYTIKGLKAATTYKVRVRAYKIVNGTYFYGDYSAYSNTATAPKKVSIKSLVSVKKKGLKLIWNKVEGASGYEIYIKEGNGKYKRIKSVSSKVTSYSRSSLKNKKTYTFKVRAYSLVNGKRIYGSFSNSKTKKIN